MSRGNESRLQLIFGGAGARLFKAVATVVVVSVPAAAVWAASSLAAYANGPIWLAVLSGGLLFPGLPLLWEGISLLVRRRQERPKKRILTFYDRLIVRTFVLNLVVLTVFLFSFPKPVFAALTTRGDWMFDRVEGSEGARAALLSVADHLSWLWDLAHENPYDDFDEDEDVQPEPVAADDSDGIASDDFLEPSPEGESLPEPEGPDRTWPFAATLHPLVADMPEEDRASIDAVARYLAAGEEDPFMLAKAVHDFVADRVAYDAAALAEGRYPPQDPETVFDTGLGVCAGYARLVREIGQKAGLEIVYVVGDARVGDETEPTGEGHAWNAVRLEDDWYLLDATWDAGSVEGVTFRKRYSSENFLTPPEIFGIKHFPDEPNWQLRAEPLSRGEFNRQPMLSPSFYMDGFRLVSPDRSQVDTRSDFVAQVRSDGSHYLMMKAQPQSGGPEIDCGTEHGRDLTLRCRLDRTGTYSVRFFTNASPFGMYAGAGSILVNRR